MYELLEEMENELSLKDKLVLFLKISIFKKNV